MSSLDSYTNFKVIGKGSYGEVSLVKHKLDKKQYVLKKLEIKHVSKRERYSAEQEAKLLSKLRHPNIVTYKDSFEDGGFLYIAMGYCEGGDLYSKLKEQKGIPLEERQIVEWFVQISMALQYMHERHILHRDLKTQNIFLTKAKIIKVGDLGIAKVLDNPGDMASTLIGTPYYMSPELFSNKPYNHKSDVWALGCCVYEMTTLKHAFNAKDMNSLVYKILRGKLPSMPKIYSDELVTMIKAMLNQNPDKRPSVNRILRDPFIKKNIALFLEGTRKSKTKQKRPPSGDRSRKSSQTDVDETRSTSVSVSSSVSAVPNDVKNIYYDPNDDQLEPLHPCGPELEPINEEDTPRKSYPPVKVADESPKASYDRQIQKKSPSSSRKNLPPPSPNESVDSNRRKKKHNILKMKRQTNESSNREPNQIIQLEKDSPLHEHHDQSRKDSFETRPLPPRPHSAGNPKAKNNDLLILPNRESGYSSDYNNIRKQDKVISKSHDPSSPTEPVPIKSSAKIVSKSQDIRPKPAPRTANSSARARRREKKEMEVKEIETPRLRGSIDMVVRQSSDIENRHVIKNRPSSARNYVSHSLQENPIKRNKSEENLKKKLVHQRSFNNSSSSDEDETKREEKRVNRDVDNLMDALETTLNAPKPRASTSEDANLDVDNTDIKLNDEELGEDEVIVNNISKVSNVRRNETFVVRKHNNYQTKVNVEKFEHRQKLRQDLNVPQAEKSFGTATRLNDRINQLRKDVVRAVGIKKLKESYDILDKVDSEEAEPKLIELLGQSGFDEFAGKIWQLKFCEEIQAGII